MKKYMFNKVTQSSNVIFSLGSVPLAINMPSLGKVYLGHPLAFCQIG